MRHELRTPSFTNCPLAFCLPHCVWLSRKVTHGLPPDHWIAFH